MTSKQFRWRLFVLICIALVVAGAWNGQRSLWDTSETRYAEASREMEANDHWLVPRIDNHPHLTKPPLAYWLYAASMSLFGTSEWFVRLPCVLAYALSIMMTALVALELTRSRSTAIIAGGLQLISPLALIGSHVVTTDVVLAAVEPAYVWAFLKVLNADKNTASRWAMAAWIFAALAFMTKGPPALLSALVCMIFLILKRRDYPHWKALVKPAPLLIFLCLSGWWYAAVLLRLPNAADVWKTEALKKVFVHSERNMPALSYIYILAVGALPAVIALAMEVFRGKFQILKQNLKLALRRNVTLLCALWVFIPLIVFMLAKTRLPLYVLPLVTPINVVGAIALNRRWGNPRILRLRDIPRGWQMLAALILITHVVTKLALGYYDDESKDMKPVATAILADAKEIGKKPQLVINLKVMGNGLLYYLNGPPAYRVERDDSVADTNTDKGANNNKRRHGSTYRLRNQAFTEPVQPGHALYIVIQADREHRYLSNFSDMVDRVYHNSHWAVWRRTEKFAPNDSQDQS